MDKPTRCIDPVLKFCQECKYGWIEYPDWVETYEDTFDCCFKSGCMYGLEKDEPTEEEIEEVKKWIEDSINKNKDIDNLEEISDFISEEKSETSKIIDNIYEIILELDARENTNNCIIETFFDKSWTELCEEAIRLLKQIK